MKTIYKYILENSAMNEIEIPAGAEYLKVDIQHDNVCLWALVNPENELTKVKFLVIGTGWNIDKIADIYDDPNILTSINKSNYIDTVIFDDGYLVYHVFKIS